MARAGRALESTSPDQNFHDVRKRAKQARYAAEAVAPALGSRSGSRARAFASRAADIQDVLGELQDAVMAQETIERYVGEDPRSAEVNFAAGRLLERQHAGRAKARSEFSAAWRKLDHKKRRSWM